MLKSLSKFILAAAVVLPFMGSVHAEDAIKIGYAKCAHCTPMSLIPQYIKGAKAEAISFNTGSDALTALVTKNIDIAQSTYLSLATALDRGFEVVAISGQVNGGSVMLLKNGINVKPNDWDALKKVIAQYKAEGKPFRVAASRGNAQDLHMRGEFEAHGIDVNKDVQFVNIPNPSDDLQAIKRGDVELVSSVDPFATQIMQAKAAQFFDYPYDQAAGKLTNIILTRPDVIKDHPQELQAAVNAIVAVNNAITTNKTLFIDTINKVTGLDKSVAAACMDNMYPDYALHRQSAIAIAKMMKNLNYISSDVSAKVESHLDYDFLVKATGKTKEELGY